ncbi:hypothetical protein Lgee_1855 [Legionella geestiana]|uniref:UPF0102 protein Lgee_1855 n=1 Tax=Legionella geestiana TaxID=45065 RepID=A0A0W0TNU1_9GAMM|nr:YraN family protein [Legionella geestiana]KTC97194.1 hypothetical protein Lgee_1855 [Legionella geestiana]STX55235.1 putative endonuclease distantly related to archaeal Holliday junction resolvase [Legionella geestiana]
MANAYGKEAEQIACVWLKRQGLLEVTRNFSCRFGEIDLVMQDADSLVFVEVRARSSAAFGGAAASVTTQKQQKIRRTAAFYLTKHPARQGRDARFDVVCLDGSPARITWIKNAFGA